jgi:hypothetical protein
MKHSLAAYPKQFYQCVVSEKKICLQFEECATKLRFKLGGEYIKLPSTEKALPITTTGTDVDYVSVGCQLGTIEGLQQALVQAYADHGRKYGPVLKDLIDQTIKSLQEIQVNQ